MRLCTIKLNAEVSADLCSELTKYILSYVKCTVFTGNVLLTLSIYFKHYKMYAVRFDVYCRS